MKSCDGCVACCLDYSNLCMGTRDYEKELSVGGGIQTPQD